MSNIMGYDLTFELNEFHKPRIRSELEMIKNIVLFILFSKPGQYPSLPTIGLNIEDRLYSFYNEIDEVELKNEIIKQCEILKFFFDSSTIGIRKYIYQDKPSLIIHIQGKEEYPDKYMNDQRRNANKYLIGITYNELNEMIYNMKAVN